MKLQVHDTGIGKWLLFGDGSEALEISREATKRVVAAIDAGHLDAIRHFAEHGTLPVEAPVWPGMTVEKHDACWHVMRGAANTLAVVESRGEALGASLGVVDMNDMVDYKKIRAVNWSTLTHIGRSALHYRHALDVGISDSVSFRKGRAMHCLVLTPDSFNEQYRVWDGKRAGKAWKAFRDDAAAAGIEVLTSSEVETAKLQAEAVLRHPAASELLARCPRREQVVQWNEPGIGPAKARLDAFGDGVILDLKGCRDAAPGPFARSVVAYSYHGQLSFYQRSFRGQVDAFLIAVEFAAPFDVVVYQLPEHVLAAGDELVARRLSRLAACRAADRWPGVSDTTLQLELPDWALGTGSETADEEDTLFGGDDDG